MANVLRLIEPSSDSLDKNPPADMLSLFMSAGGGCLTDVEQLELWECIQNEVSVSLCGNKKREENG